MPIGVPIATAMIVRIRLPTIGLSRPPAAPGGGVISVKTATDRPLKPFHNSAPRISTSQPSPTAVAANASTFATTSLRRRPEWGEAEVWSGMVSPDPAFDAQQQVSRDSQDDKGNDEQDQAERDQRRGIQVADRFGEFVGDGGGDGGAGCK